jgi:hypothetical protein
MRRFFLIAALAGCGDKAVDELTALKERACQCATYQCLDQVSTDLEAHAADWKDPSHPEHAKKAAEAVMECLASTRARIDDDTRRAIEEKLHGVDSGP